MGACHRRGGPHDRLDRGSLRPADGSAGRRAHVVDVMEAVAMFSTAAIQIRALPVPLPAEAALATACLSASEHRLMAIHRHPRRRLEFLAGRVAIKRALLET